MKKYKYLLWVLGILVMLFSFWFFYLKDFREHRLIKEGNTLVEKIEVFRTENKRLPTSLDELGIEERDGIDVLYYDKRDSLHYTVSFGTSLGESVIYYSDTKQWEDRYREIK
ncbi:hypothetical protein DSECCO2_314140 [anaerobic digester metagenome]